MTAIMSLLEQIDKKEIVLPAIQRNFVWSKEKIETLMDSILRGYPVGIVLMWETYEDVQYRLFEDVYKESTKTDAFLDNQEKKKLTLVLDGQQRLQSLYVGLYGRHNGAYLYFDVLSGRHLDNFEEEKYVCAFMTESEAKKHNANAQDQGPNDEEEKKYFHKIRSLFDMAPEEKKRYETSLVKSLGLSEDDSVRLSVNLGQIDHVFAKNADILQEYVIDKNKSAENKSRQTESDVLEIFVRINRQGTNLSRSDFIFSMLKLSWRDSATDLPEFVKKINAGNSFSLDIDFVVRCLFAVSDLGTKFDIDLLRTKSNIEKMQNNFFKCCAAIQATVDYVQKHCWVSSNKAFGSTLNLVPFVYYLFYVREHRLPHGQIEHFRKAFFLFCFSKIFSRYADSRLRRFIQAALLPLKESSDSSFPLDKAWQWTTYWGEVDSFNATLVQRNPRLALHLIQGDVGGKAKHKLNAREMDHIFPSSVLREKGFDEAQIGHFANFWILEKGWNINKSNKPPKSYFQNVPESELKRALIDRDMLDYCHYETFLEKREKAMLEKLRKKIGFDK